MPTIITYQSRKKGAALRAEFVAYCKPHGIDPHSVASILLHESPEPSYKIEYYNKDGHFCTITVVPKT